MQCAQNKIKGNGFRFENLDHGLQEALRNPYAEESEKENWIIHLNSRSV